MAIKYAKDSNKTGKQTDLTLKVQKPFRFQCMIQHSNEKMFVDVRTHLSILLLQSFTITQLMAAIGRFTQPERKSPQSSLAIAIPSEARSGGRSRGLSQLLSPPSGKGESC
jgi:hypothetical protein